MPMGELFEDVNETKAIEEIEEQREGVRRFRLTDGPWQEVEKRPQSNPPAAKATRMRSSRSNRSSFRKSVSFPIQAMRLITNVDPTIQPSGPMGQPLVGLPILFRWARGSKSESTTTRR